MKKLCLTGVLLIAVILFTHSAGLVYGQGEPFEAWVALYHGSYTGEYVCAVAVDASGNVYVTGHSGGSLATVKYDSTGTQLWHDRSYWGRGSAIAVDASGNVYVTGTAGDRWKPKEWDYITIKYDPNGNEQWAAQYEGEPGISWDEGQAIALDAAGNIYVTGNSHLSATSGDFCTIKYDPNGNEIWVARYNGHANGWDDGRAIAVDAAGDIYVAGKAFGISGSADYCTIKYDPDGNEIWVAQYNGPGDSHDVLYAMAIGASGSIYVTGESINYSNRDYCTVKYDPDGNQLWVARYDGPDNLWDWASAIAIDSSENIYVTGGSEGIETERDFATVKYDSDGNELWVARYDGPDNLWDWAVALAIDSSDNVYVAGISRRINDGISANDYCTIKYDPDGNQLWVGLYNGSGNYHDGIEAMTIDDSGNVYVAGTSYSEYSYPCGGMGEPQTCYSRQPDYATIKYDTQISKLIAKVNSLIDTGVLTQPHGNGLIAKLEEAAKVLNKKKPNRKAACNKILDLIEQVNAHINSGKLSPEEGQELIEAAEDISNTICG